MAAAVLGLHADGRRGIRAGVRRTHAAVCTRRTTQGGSRFGGQAQGQWPQPFLHHGVLGLAEIEHALLDACQANGLVRDDGLSQCQASLSSGLRKAANDQLPLLGVSRRR